MPAGNAGSERRHSTFIIRLHCEPTGRANARPMTGSAKQSILPRAIRKTGLLRRGVYHRARPRRDPLAPRHDGGDQEASNTETAPPPAGPDLLVAWPSPHDQANV